MSNVKIKYFKPPTQEEMARFMAVHLPKGRVWNTKTGTNLYRLCYSVASGLLFLYNLIWQMITNFNINTSEDLTEWEESYDITPPSGATIQERRDVVKANVSKIPVVTASEWQIKLRDATGSSIITVTPAKDVTITTTFPRSFPIQFQRLTTGTEKEKRFVVYVQQIADKDEQVLCENLVKKFQPSNVKVIYILV